MFLKLYFIALPIFFALDMLWLGVVAKTFYAKHLGYLMAPVVNWIAVMMFYLLFIAGLVVFVIGPAMEKNSWQHALVMGALFGIVSYATYDLTNLATIKNWPLIVTIVDMVWGMILASSVSILSFFFAKKIGL